MTSEEILCVAQPPAAYVVGTDTSLQIRRASPEDFEAIVDTLEEAAAWAQSIAAPTWPPGSFRDPNGRGHGSISAALREGNLHVVVAGDCPVGTVTLQTTDPIFWPDAPDDALYVHKLALRQAARGRGLGRCVLEWAENRARAAGKNFLRLDTHRRNSRLRRWYEEERFVHRGDLTTSFEASRYERQVRPR